MLLKKITIDNYGLYKGEVSFDLAPREKYGKIRPAILFGGKNGAGKTTLFDAFRLALYGKSTFGNRISEAEYKTQLRNKIHRSPKGTIQPSSASITIEFDHVSLGERHEYVVKRAWTKGNGKGVIEKLSIEQNGTPLTGVNSSFWQGFVEEIIPERISSLFFFDGEKIKRIADDTEGNRALADSIRTLLGLDIVDRLESDLNIYKSREAQKHSDTDYAELITELNNEISVLEEQITIATDQLAESQTAIHGIERTIAKCERNLYKEGQVYAERRESLKHKKSTSEAEIDSLRKAIQYEYEGLYPLSQCPSIAKKLCSRLKEEKKYRNCKQISSELDLLMASISKELKHKRLPEAVKLVESVIHSRINELDPPSDFTETLAYSDEDAEQILTWFNTAQNETLSKVKHLRSNYEEQLRVRQEAEKQLLKIPSDEILAPLVDELHLHNKRLGAQLEERRVKQEEMRLLSNRLQDAKRRLEKIIRERKSTDDAGNRVKLATRIQKALGAYSDQLTREKISQLRETVADCFNMLSRKGDLIKTIDINPDTFAVTLLDRYGNTLPKEELSAGEKQMYAVAMLWGLSLTSGRPLPVIIDTPLGRLDSDHRRKLVHNYFPKASEQVIILSTDTEIDEEWYKELSPQLSHCYHLSYEPDENRTKVTNGYFWR